ncbi:MAG: pyridoxamine 5'-phosphate oxidase family protein, partial [Actinomycetota bacterium]
MSTRPTSHGGGEAGPPIAGDPSTFPSDAELSRTLVAANRIASLSTLTAEGYPYGSVVSYAADDDGAPVVLISEQFPWVGGAGGRSKGKSARPLGCRGSHLSRGARCEN